jgi:cytochrome c553
MTMSVVLAAAVAMMMLASGQTMASPAIAQKTGEACAKCHSPAPPALNDYGKKYKK